VRTVLLEADEAVFAGAVPALADVVDLCVDDEADLLLEDVPPADDFLAADVFGAGCDVLAGTVCLALSAFAAGAIAVQTPHSDTIRIRFISSTWRFSSWL